MDESGTSPASAGRATKKAPAADAPKVTRAPRKAAGTVAKATPRPASPRPRAAAPAGTTRPRPRPAAKVAPAAPPDEQWASPEPPPVLEARAWTPAPRRAGPEPRRNGSATIAGLVNDGTQPRVAAAPRVAIPVVTTPPPGPRRTGLIVAVVAAVAALGAGGVFLAGDNTPSKTAFIAKADAVCATANRSVSSVGKPTNYPDVETAAGTVAKATQAQLGQLRNLKLPGDPNFSAAGSMVSALEYTDNAVHSLSSAALHKSDTDTASATKKLSGAFGAAASQARAFGLTECAVGMQTAMDNVTAGSKEVVKTAFIAKADSLCRETARKIGAIPLPKSDLQDLARYIRAAYPYTNLLVEQMKDLTAPPGDEATVAAMLDAQQKVNANALELSNGVTANDRGRFVSADAAATALNTAADAKFDAYGLSVCGSNFGR